jgi:phosphate transport system substrate-binding protein
VADLKRLWEPDSQIKLWSDLKPEWPKEPIKLYGADTDSGTFDYFTEEICGKKGASRTDYTPSSDDNVLVHGVSGDKYALAYFGYAYYASNADKLKIVGIQNGDGAECVEPNKETIETGKYVPLSRPLFLYVNKKTLARPEMQEFLRYYLNEGQKYVTETKYVSAATETLAAANQALEAAISGK